MKRILILISVHILMTDAAVTVTIQNDPEGFACGKPETLICSTDPNISSMTWQINNTLAASCNILTCTVNQQLPAKYTFTFNVTSGIFSLDINRVTLSDNGTLFMCDDGSSSDSAQALVQVSDDFTITQGSSVDDGTGMTVFSVSTGCIKSTIAETVTVSWFYKPVNGKERKEMHQAFSEKDDSLCTADPECDTEELTQWLSVLNITDDDNGDLCTIEVEIIHGSFTDKKTFEETVRIKFGFEDEFPSWIFVVICLACVLVIIQYVMVVYHCCRISRTCSPEWNRKNCQFHGFQYWQRKTEYQQRPHSTTQRETFICDKCNSRQPSIMGYCMDCEKFLCNGCPIRHKCKGILLRHLQPEASGRQFDLCCDKIHDNHNQKLLAHGYCLSCGLYLCTFCLMNHRNHNLLWIPNNADAKKDTICCYKGHIDGSHIPRLGFCMQCKEYLCIDCSERHENHFLVMHYKQDDVSRSHQKTECGKCKSIADCFHFESKNFLCLICYDHGRFPRKKRVYDGEIMEIITKREQCSIHHAFGEGHVKFSLTDVYCLICKMYMCKGCFKTHRRLEEIWIKEHEDNLFTCKKCQENGEIYPVECLMLKSATLLCAVCVEDNDTNTFKAPRIQDKHVRQTLQDHFNINMPCELHKIPFQTCEETIESTMYCLLCKTYMCKSCFWKHRRLLEVWRDRERFRTLSLEEQISARTQKHTKYQTPDPEIKAGASNCKLIMLFFGFFPVVGLVFLMLFVFRKNAIQTFIRRITSRKQGKRPSQHIR